MVADVVTYNCLNCGFSAPGEGGIATCAQCGTLVEPVESEPLQRDVEQAKREGAGIVPQRPASAWATRPHGIIIMDDPVQEQTPEQREAMLQFARERLGLEQADAESESVTFESIDLE